MIAILSHHVKSGENIYQPLIDNLEINLKELGKDYFLLAHSLEGDFLPFLKENGRVKSINMSQKGIFRYFQEIQISLKILQQKQPKKIIGLNPLNAFAGLIYKKIYDKNVKVCYYIPDFSPQRFTNSFLNKIYHSVENFCTKNADEVWVVSKKVFEMKSGKNKNVYLYYNYPPEKLRKKLKNKERKGLVLAGLINDYYVFDQILEFLKLQKNEVLNVIGGGKSLEKYQEKVLENNLEKRVNFLGYIEKENFLQELNKYKISLALYNLKQEYNLYGDSVKCRDSIALFTPIITTNNHSTAQDIKKYELGVVLDAKNVSGEEILKNYEKIINNYEFYTKNMEKYYFQTNKNEQILSNFLNS